jgi:hypothetical protein
MRAHADKYLGKRVIKPVETASDKPSKVPAAHVENASATAR